MSVPLELKDPPDSAGGNFRGERSVSGALQKSLSPGSYALRAVTDGMQKTASLPSGTCWHMSSHGRDLIDCLHFLWCLKILGKPLEIEPGKALTSRLCGQNRGLELSAELSCCLCTRQHPVYSARLCFPATELTVWLGETSVFLLCLQQ